MAIIRNQTTQAAATPAGGRSAMPVVCQTCEGCGKLDSEKRLPWRRFQNGRNSAVTYGLIQPLVCERCQGLGYVSSEQVAEETQQPPAPQPAPAPASKLPKTRKTK